MGDQIKRYDLDYGRGWESGASMEPDDLGDYVCYSDHASLVRDLQERIATLESKLSHAIQESKILASLAEKVTQERDALKAQVPRWIPVGERLPGHGINVLIRTRKGNAFLVYAYDRYMDGRIYYAAIQGDLLPENVTYWMPLPDPPKDSQ